VRCASFAVLSAALLFSGSATAIASEGVPGVERPAPRLRFDVSGGFAVGVASNSQNSPQVSASAIVPTVVVDVGVQLADPWALYGRVAGGSALVSHQGEAYLIGEWTPRRWISLATGIGVDYLGAPQPGPIRGDWAGVSVPLLVGFNVDCPPPEGARRSALRLGLEGAAGSEPGTGVPGWHVGAAFGGAWM
jgi:hypothetical protein